MAVRVELRRDAGRIDPSRSVWIRERQIARVHGPPDPLAIAALVDHRGRVLGHGLYSPDSRIVLRLLCAGEAPPPSDWLARRLAAALAGRRALGFGRPGDAATTGFRELNSEGDGVPGLVVDRFGDWRVVQITTAPIAARREAILALLDELAPAPAGTITLLPPSAAAREGFEAAVEIDGEGPTQLEWREHGRSFSAPFRRPPQSKDDGKDDAKDSAPPTQKTGAYHDQRDNRQRVAELVRAWISTDARGPRVLDLGCHVGGFAIAAAGAGAEVVAVDRSAPALDHLRRNAEANGVLDRITVVCADMFGALDSPELAGHFELLLFDPPKIASSRRDLDRAIKAMRTSLARLLPRLRDEGLALLCSCSHHLGWDELDRVMQGASRTRQFARLARWGAGLDHPVAPGHDEGEYLRVALYQARAAKFQRDHG